MRHTAVHRYGTNCQLKLKGQEAQIASQKSLSNKNGTYRFVNIFLICGDENIYVLIVLFTNILTKLSRFLVS